VLQYNKFVFVHLIGIRGQFADNLCVSLDHFANTFHINAKLQDF